MKTKNKKAEFKPLRIVPDFFNKLAQDLDKKYFPEVKYYHDDKNDAKVHYAVECFNNGVMGYETLIKKLSAACKDTPENIHKIVSKYIADFGDYVYKPVTPIK